jgi:uncharacterized membrane protein YfcA
MQSFLLLILGCLAGLLSGLFGIGGGAVLVPGMVLVLGLNLSRAAGISLAALLLPVGLLGVMVYVRDGRLDRASLGMAAWVAGGLFLGTWLGAHVSAGLSALQLRRGFALLLVLLAVRIWFSGDAL